MSEIGVIDLYVDYTLARYINKVCEKHAIKYDGVTLTDYCYVIMNEFGEEEFFFDKLHCMFSRDTIPNTFIDTFIPIPPAHHTKMIFNYYRKDSKNPDTADLNTLTFGNYVDGSTMSKLLNPLQLDSMRSTDDEKITISGESNEITINTHLRTDPKYYEEFQSFYTEIGKIMLKKLEDNPIVIETQDDADDENTSKITLISQIQSQILRNFEWQSISRRIANAKRKLITVRFIPINTTKLDDENRQIYESKVNNFINWVVNINMIISLVERLRLNNTSIWFFDIQNKSDDNSTLIFSASKKTNEIKNSEKIKLTDEEFIAIQLLYSLLNKYLIKPSENDNENDDLDITFGEFELTPTFINQLEQILEPTFFYDDELFILRFATHIFLKCINYFIIFVNETDAKRINPELKSVNDLGLFNVVIRKNQSEYFQDSQFVNNMILQEINLEEVEVEEKVVQKPTNLKSAAPQLIRQVRQNNGSAQKISIVTGFKNLRQQIESIAQQTKKKLIKGAKTAQNTFKDTADKLHKIATSDTSKKIATGALSVTGAIAVSPFLATAYVGKKTGEFGENIAQKINLRLNRFENDKIILSNGIFYKYNASKQQFETLNYASNAVTFTVLTGDNTTNENVNFIVNVKNPVDIGNYSLIKFFPSQFVQFEDNNKQIKFGIVLEKNKRNFNPNSDKNKITIFNFSTFDEELIEIQKLKEISDRNISIPNIIYDFITTNIDKVNKKIYVERFFKLFEFYKSNFVFAKKYLLFLCYYYECKIYDYQRSDTNQSSSIYYNKIPQFDFDTFDSNEILNIPIKIDSTFNKLIEKISGFKIQKTDDGNFNDDDKTFHIIIAGKYIHTNLGKASAGDDKNYCFQYDSENKIILPDELNDEFTMQKVLFSNDNNKKVYVKLLDSVLPSEKKYKFGDIIKIDDKKYFVLKITEPTDNNKKFEVLEINEGTPPEKMSLMKAIIDEFKVLKSNVTKLTEFDYSKIVDWFIENYFGVNEDKTLVFEYFYSIYKPLQINQQNKEFKTKIDRNKKFKLMCKFQGIVKGIVKSEPPLNFYCKLKNNSNENPSCYKLIYNKSEKKITGSFDPNLLVSRNDNGTSFDNIFNNTMTGGDPSTSSRTPLVKLESEIKFSEIEEIYDNKITDAEKEIIFQSLINYLKNNKTTILHIYYALCINEKITTVKFMEIEYDKEKCIKLFEASILPSELHRKYSFYKKSNLQDSDDKKTYLIVDYKLNIDSTNDYKNSTINYIVFTDSNDNTQIYKDDIIINELESYAFLFKLGDTNKTPSFNVYDFFYNIIQQLKGKFEFDKKDKYIQYLTEISSKFPLNFEIILNILQDKVITIENFVFKYMLQDYVNRLNDKTIIWSKKTPEKKCIVQKISENNKLWTFPDFQKIEIDDQSFSEGWQIKSSPKFEDDISSCFFLERVDQSPTNITVLYFDEAFKKLLESKK